MRFHDVNYNFCDHSEAKVIASNADLPNNKFATHGHSKNEKILMTLLLFNLYTNYFLRKCISKRHHTTNRTFE